MPKSVRATSAVKHTMPPRPVVGAQLTLGRDWLPESITSAPKGCHAGPPALRATSPASIPWNQDRLTRGEAGKCDRRCALFNGAPRVSRQMTAATVPCKASGAR